MWVAPRTEFRAEKLELGGGARIPTLGEADAVGVGDSLAAYAWRGSIVGVGYTGWQLLSRFSSTISWIWWTCSMEAVISRTCSVISEPPKKECA